MPGEPITMRRPPVRQATTVRRGVTHTFEVFVATIARWWPLRPFSAGHDTGYASWRTQLWTTWPSAV